MPEIPVGRIAFSISGKQYEIQAPDLAIQSSAEFVNHTFERGAESERQRIRTKIEEMRESHLDKNKTSNSITYPWVVLQELLRWLDKEAP